MDLSLDTERAQGAGQGESDERVFYTCCAANGCWDASCILKCHVKNGRLVHIESDDSINAGACREDVGWENIYTGMVQMRPCAMGHAWKEELYGETRLLHPMKRIGEKGPGKGYFVQIGWEEALDTIAEKMQEIRDKYGPYAFYHTNSSGFDSDRLPISPWWECGFTCWGDHSTSGHTAGENFHLGFDLTRSLVSGTSPALPGFEAADLFNSKLIVMWGMDPVVDWFGPTSYYMMLAHEYGCKTIVIDPRYTASCETLADQWIPIRPGTDLAMELAVAQVLFEEDLYDHDYVEQWVEPEGFAQWRAYCMGEGEDGVKKTPEWAAPITAVPADTIRDFARLYGTTKPVHLQFFYSCAKRHLGEYSAAAAMLLQAMTGNLTVPGGCQTGSALPTPGRMPTPYADFGRAPAKYKAPSLINSNKLSETLACQKDYWEGRMSESEFRHRIGSPTDDAPLPNVQMIIIENNYVNNCHDTNKRMLGFASTEFNWGFQWHINQPSMEFCDIVLPAPVWQFEGMDELYGGHQRFQSGPSGMRNYFVFCDAGCDYPGEVRSKEWVWTQIAKRLGVADEYNPRLKDVDWRDFTKAQRAIYREAYENWAANETYMRFLGIEEPQSLEEFCKKPVVRIPVYDPYYPYKSCTEAGINPFETESGKIEFVSRYVEKTDLTKTKWRGKLDPMPTWTPSYVSADIGHASEDGFYNPKARKYPLSLVTPVSIYRQHSSNDNNPMLREECYRHGVWLSPVDAKARGIEDGDTVRAVSETGEVVLAAYVTSRMMPGTAAIHHGAWYQGGGEPTNLDPFGMDMRGAPNMLLNDIHLPHIVGALLTAGLIEVEKVSNGDADGFGPEAERAGLRGALATAVRARVNLGEKPFSDDLRTADDLRAAGGPCAEAVPLVAGVLVPGGEASGKAEGKEVV